MDEFGVRVRKLILEKCMVIRTLRILCPVRVVPAFVLSTGNKECIDTIIIIIILLVILCLSFNCYLQHCHRTKH